MSKLLLLVQTEADVQHLDGAAQAILNSAITGVWVVFSPAITVNASEAAAKLDVEIAQLDTAERAAADRKDYTAAAGYKTQREGKELDRQKVLRDAWKNAPAEERQRKTKEIFAPFGDALKAKGLAVRITNHSDHYDREQWVAMLNSLSGVWDKNLTSGGFLVAWPEAVETMIPKDWAQITKEVFKTSGPVVRQEIPTEVVTKVDQEPKSRRDELTSMKYFTLVGAAKKAGVDPTGKKGPQIIEEILAAEAKTEPALAEY
jgi:hypothetical protein